ncbi:MAG TPA: hypothetical protein VGD64_04080 [Acidisarcina sp.]
MKRNLIATFALAVAAMAVSAPAVIAQSESQATIPFNFQVARSSMPAGTYVLETNGFGPVSVRDTHNGHTRLALGMAEQSNKASHSRLIFHRYGSKYFLAEIWGGGTTGVKVPETKQEAEYRASNESPMQEQVVLLAMLKEQ